MIVDKFYLSDPSNINNALLLTGLNEDELEQVVGRFKSDHYRWPNMLKGEVILTTKHILIKHHFTKKVLLKMAVEGDHFDY